MVDKLKSTFSSKKKKLPKVNEELITKKALEEKAREESGQPRIMHYTIKYYDKTI